MAFDWENYNTIKAYLDEHGELPLKEASITLPTGSQSQWWIRNQTLMLHQGKQSEDKVKLLNEIGIVKENGLCFRGRGPFSVLAEATEAKKQVKNLLEVRTMGLLIWYNVFNETR